MNDTPKELQSISGFIAPSIAPSEATEQPYFTIRQGNATNDFTKMKAKKGKNLTVDSITDIATIQQGGLTVTMPNSSVKNLKTSTQQLFDALTIAFTESGAKSPTVKLSLSKYMNMRGLKDRKAAKAQAIADMDALRGQNWSFEETRGKEKESYKFVNIADSGEVKRNGDIVFTYGATFYRLLLTYAVMDYPPQLLQLNAKSNPNSYSLGRKLTELKRMNAGKPNEDIVSVKTLLQYAPALPTFEEVMRTNRHLTERIIEPFERDLNALSSILTWEYCHSGKTPLTEDDLQTFDYSTFIDLCVSISWVNFPDQQPRIDHKAQKIEAQKEKRKRATSKKKPSTTD